MLKRDPVHLPDVKLAFGERSLGRLDDDLGTCKEGLEQS
jgi:hypothetical protein